MTGARSATITAFSRLHFGLGDVLGVTGRAYGGAGLMLDGHGITVTGTDDNMGSLEGFETLDAAAQADVRATKHRLSLQFPETSRTSLKLEGEPPLQHIGLGSKTALLLATVTASCGATRTTISPENAQRLTLRGGASGIGVHGFFTGGLVADVGHPRAKVDNIGPSATRIHRADTLMPSVATTLRVPESWRFRLLLPSVDSRLHGRSECDLFEEAGSLDGAEVLASIAHLWHGIIPAVIESDLTALGRSLRGLARTGFKRREIHAHPPYVRQLLSQAEEIGAAGMSSMGPLVYVVHDRSDISAIRALDRLAASSPCVRDLGTVRAQNSPYSISYA